MKLIAITLVFVGCALAGFWIDEDQRKRLVEIEKFIFIFELLKAEIDYRLTPLKEACMNVSQRSDRQMQGVLLSFAKRLEEKESGDVGEMWHQSLVEHKRRFHLKEEDYQLLRSFGGVCGYLDKAMEKRSIEMLVDELRYERDQSKVKYEKDSKLYRSLGILIGLVLSIYLL